MKKVCKLLIMSALVFLVACSSDDVVTNLAEQVTGTYTGYVNAVAQYFPDGMKNGDQSLTIFLGDNGEYSLRYSSDTWGTFNIDNIKVENDDNGDFRLSGSGKCAMGMNGSSKDYDCTFTATIDAKKEKPEFIFTVPAVMGGLTITFHMGSMPTE